uniref:Enkurin domain-containing protein n=2 Tax=Lotharella globosa TaxID=91324 RepID=A0A6V3QVN9_9EUKA
MRYVEKPEYGKVPEYLREVKSDIEKEKQFIEQMLEKSKAASETEQKSRVMDESEKEELLDALKLKWQDVNEKYQKISHIVNHDTIGKKLRKEQYEAEMDELEAAIRKLSKGTVLISDD